MSAATQSGEGGVLRSFSVIFWTANKHHLQIVILSSCHFLLLIFLYRTVLAAGNLILKLICMFLAGRLQFVNDTWQTSENSYSKSSFRRSLGGHSGSQVRVGAQEANIRVRADKGYHFATPCTIGTSVNHT
jgi:hypothetical protein